MVGIDHVAAAAVKLRWGGYLLVYGAVCLCQGRDGDLVFVRRATTCQSMFCTSTCRVYILLGTRSAVMELF
jgi:hypothetical protein